MTTKELILHKVLEIGEANTTQVAFGLNLSHSTIKSQMTSLANEGKLTRVLRGVYAVSEKWEAILI
jgi:DeoR/GlpR family transcriptional regulator of sugar metabolism